MKMVTIAALAAAQLSAAAWPAQGAELPAGEVAAQRRGLEEGIELSLRDEQTPASQAAAAPVTPRGEAAQEDEPRKKHKSTGDKVLTGAAVILGIGALAVGGLLIALVAS
jgi:hypothetical protein